MSDTDRIAEMEQALDKTWQALDATAALGMLLTNFVAAHSRRLPPPDRNHRALVAQVNHLVEVALANPHVVAARNRYLQSQQSCTEPPKTPGHAS